MLPFDCITCKRFQLCDLIQSRNCREVTLVSGIPVPAPIHTWICLTDNFVYPISNPLVWSSASLLEQSCEDSYHHTSVRECDYCREVSLRSMLKLDWKNSPDGAADERGLTRNDVSQRHIKGRYIKWKENEMKNLPLDKPFGKKKCVWSLWRTRWDSNPGIP